MIDGQGDCKMRIARSAPSRFLLATLCCLSMQAAGDANAADPQASPAEPSVARAEALRKRGHAAYDAGQFAEALRHYDEAYRLDPHDASILMLRGGTYKELGRCKEAIADFDAFEKQHNHIADFLLIGNVFVNRAYCRMQLKDYAAAVGDLEDQVRYKPDDDWAWAELGRAYGFLKQYEESEAALKRAIKLNPGDPYAHYQLGLVYMVSGRSRDAIPYLQTTVRLEPGNQDAKELLDAAIAETSGKPATAASGPAAAPSSGAQPTPAPVSHQITLARPIPPATEQSVAGLQGDCARGSAQACYWLADKYATGKGVPKDEATSARLYEQACQGKLLIGCTLLGMQISTGQGVPQSYERATTIWRNACDAGEPNSCTMLGAMYELRRVPKDPATAAVYYQKGCNGGHGDGCTQLSKLYRSGLGVPQDAAKADELWQLGCKRGSSHCEQGQPPAGTSTAAKSAKPASATCKVARVQLGVDTVASVERDIQARGGSPGSVRAGSQGIATRSEMYGDYRDVGTNIMAVNYDFDSAEPTGRLIAVRIANHANSGPDFEKLLAERKAALAAVAGPLQQKSATEFVASAPGCQLRLLPNPGTYFIHEVYALE
ncbi:MAG: tetratricopeptide repeat protein [Steroidobacteraceae bacterium]|nr:tetratricopeptide repeat protein [Steroidobacteraceae bacterium]